MTYKWTDLSKTEQNQARQIRDQLAKEGIGASVSQIAKYFDEATDYAVGRYDRDAFIELVSGVTVK